jgi:aspartate beta-hydroxylase/beta-hydroxylase
MKGALETGITRLVNRYIRSLKAAAGGDRRPVFFDVATTAPALLELDRHYAEIRAEVEALLASGVNLPRLHDLDPRQVGISGRSDKKWKVFLLYSFGAKPKANRSRCPKTSALLDRVPNLTQAFFSILEAGKSVPAHDGPYPGQIRYHLGLIVPKANPPTLRVKDQFHTWTEGGSVIFDDTWNHEVLNQCTEDRVVLIVDVLRPMSPAWNVVNRVFTRGLVRTAYTSGVLKNLDKFR